MASLAEGYCSLITRASQFSSTTRNLVPRFKRWIKGGKVLVAKNLMSLLGLGCPFEEVDPFRWCLHFYSSSLHDQVVILSSGSPSSYERDQGEKLRKNASPLRWASEGELNGKYIRYPHELYFSGFVECIIRWYQSFKRVGNHSMTRQKLEWGFEQRE